MKTRLRRASAGTLRLLLLLWVVARCDDGRLRHPRRRRKIRPGPPSPAA